MTALVNRIEDPLCRQWIGTTLEKVASAAGKRNNVIHSDYFADLSRSTSGFLMQTKPARTKPQIRHNGIKQQIAGAIDALHEAHFYMGFA